VYAPGEVEAWGVRTEAPIHFIHVDDVGAYRHSKERHFARYGYVVAQLHEAGRSRWSTTTSATARPARRCRWSRTDVTAPVTLRFAGWDARRGGVDEVTLAPEAVVEAARHLALPFPRDLGAFRGPVLGQSALDPRIGRWALVVLEPDAALATDALAPLIEQRVRQRVAFAAGAPNAQPGVLRIKRPKKERLDLWQDRMRDALDGVPPPYYLVFVGGPDRIPFDVQFLYDRDSATGRIDPGLDLDGAPPAAGEPAELDRAALRAYAEKVVRFERGKLPIERRALLYSVTTDAPIAESHQRLIAPLAQHLVGDAFPRAPGAAPIPPATLFRDDATTAALCSRLQTTRPALVVTASYGLEFPEDPALWGALTDASLVGARGGRRCRRRPSPGASRLRRAPSCCRSPASAPASPRGACTRSCGRGREAQVVDRPMTAALPRALFAHPEGPIAFVGHFDRATSGAFDPHGRSPERLPALPGLDARQRRRRGPRARNAGLGDGHVPP
jgi:hypothetical protein